jgi:hypothetical protein
MTNGHKLSITCPQCKTTFTVPLPVSELLNTLVVSIVVATHPKPATCISCGTRFLLGLTGYQLKWSAQVIAEEEAAKVDESRIVTP